MYYISSIPTLHFNIILIYSHKPNYQQAMYRLIPNDVDDPTWFIKTRFQDYSFAVISMELLYKLTLFKYLMSQDNINWRNYNSYVFNYITWLKQLYNVFTTQWMLNVCMYKISQNRYTLVNLSPHMFIG